MKIRKNNKICCIVGYGDGDYLIIIGFLSYYGVLVRPCGHLPRLSALAFLLLDDLLELLELLER